MTKVRVCPVAPPSARADRRLAVQAYMLKSTYLAVAFALALGSAAWAAPAPWLLSWSAAPVEPNPDPAVRAQLKKHDSANCLMRPNLHNLFDHAARLNVGRKGDEPNRRP